MGKDYIPTNRKKARDPFEESMIKSFGKIYDATDEDTAFTLKKKFKF